MGVLTYLTLNSCWLRTQIQGVLGRRDFRALHKGLSTQVMAREAAAVRLVRLPLQVATHKQQGASLVNIEQEGLLLCLATIMPQHCKEHDTPGRIVLASAKENGASPVD